MNIAELKEGNYIRLIASDFSIRVESISVDANLINNIYDAEDCLGISLTEDILLNNGFSRHDCDSDLFTGIYYSYNSYILYKYDQTFFQRTFDINSGFLIDETTPIQYIHTLQNSYFDTIANELNIRAFG